MKRTAAVLYGLVGYVFFFGTFLYAIGFVGNVGVSKSIDKGSFAPPLTAMLIDLSLLGVFAVQHSVMARRGFKRVWVRIVPPPVERTTYVVAASLALALILWQWRPIPRLVWDVSDTTIELVLQAWFWMGWGILLVSTLLVNHFELFGLAQVWTYYGNRNPDQSAFRAPALYRLVRHPIYLGFLIGFWSTPKMTLGHLLFSVATTAYILLGIYCEERDLIAGYGNTYHEYRRRVPMLVPFSKRTGASEKKVKTIA